MVSSQEHLPLVTHLFFDSPPHTPSPQLPALWHRFKIGHFLRLGIVRFLRHSAQFFLSRGALAAQACDFPLSNLKSHLIIRISKGQAVDGKPETIG
jgi:hypothetical protein